LIEERSSFADILDENRGELAINYIKDNSLPLIEVSSLLGFSDSSAFREHSNAGQVKHPLNLFAENLSKRSIGD
jgi:hypothetical protein